MRKQQLQSRAKDAYTPSPGQNSVSVILFPYPPFTKLRLSKGRGAAEEPNSLNPPIENSLCSTLWKGEGGPSPKEQTSSSSVAFHCRQGRRPKMWHYFLLKLRLPDPSYWQALLYSLCTRRIKNWWAPSPFSASKPSGTSEARQIATMFLNHVQTKSSQSPHQVQTKSRLSPD